MRTIFVSTLCELAKADKRIWLLTGDLGYNVLEEFEKSFPERYVNVGIAEQNMIGIASGLALSGKIVFVYSVVNFATIRCLEQIKNDVCYSNLNVKIVTVGAGFAYGCYGYSHHGVEDIAVMRSLPNIKIIAPENKPQTELATKAIIKTAGSFYLRLGYVNQQNEIVSPPLEIGKALNIQDGKDVFFITTGGMLDISLSAVNLLKKSNISAGILSMPTIKPIDKQAILMVAKKVSRIVTVEEHSITGGLGSAVAEVLSENGSNVKLRRCGIKDYNCNFHADREGLFKFYGLTPEGLVSDTFLFIKYG